MKSALLHSIWVASIFLTGSCTYSNININSPQDNNEGKIFLKRLYEDVAIKNYKAIDNLTTDSLRQLAGPDGIDKMLKIINDKVGDYKSYKIDDFYIKNVMSINTEIFYYYKLRVTYEKGTVEEIIALKSKNGSGIKLNSYHANSDLLIR